MKKLLFTLVSLLSLLVMTTGAVFAAPLKDGVLSLLEVRNDKAGGVILVFNVSGEFSKSELKNGIVFFGDEKYELNCNLEGTVLTCTTSRATAGQYVTVNLAGFIFWTFVPEAAGIPASIGPTEYCYGVYDLYYDEGTGDYWKQFDTYCQEAPANYGDILDDFYNPDYGDYYDYEFLPSSPGCFDPVSEDAYYYICGS